MNIDQLLEPGGLFKSALFGTLLRDHVDVVELAPGARVGPYEIEGPLGQGGMGVVYVARRADGQFERRVAIKFLARRVAAPRVHDEFRRERKIVAALNHAHIAHLLDGGIMEDGRLWFAAELVEGLPIDDYCVEQGLHVRQRVALLCPIVAAVQYAHSQLLIHRDIKPANVVVDRERGAKLLDFGVATLIGDDDEAIAYTPAYASPEQLAGERIGTSSDIWQLGNLLRVVLDARAPGAPAPALPADLQAIIAKACARPTARRYHTAQGLHDDLTRWLEGKAVWARPATLRYRLGCFARRHPFSLGAALATLFLLAGTLVLGWRLAAERSVAQNERELSSAMTKFVTDDLIGEANPYGGSAHPTVDLGNMLAHASERAAGTFARHPRLASELDLAMATSLDAMDRQDDARKVIQRALARLDADAAPDFGLVMSLKVLNAEIGLTNVDNETSRKRLTELHDAIAARLGPTSSLALHAQTLIGVTYHSQQRAPECAATLRDVLQHKALLRPIDVLYASSSLSHCAMWLGNFDEALEMAEAQAASQCELYGSSDPRALLSRMVVISVANASGKFARALTEGRALLVQARGTLGNEDDGVSSVLAETGVAAMCSGQYAEALQDFEQTIAIRSKTLGPRNVLVLKSMLNEALVYTRTADFANAEKSFALAESVLQEHPDDVNDQIVMLTRRGELRLAQQRNDDAFADFARALELARDTKSDALLRNAPIKLGLAVAHARRGQAAQAAPLVAEATATLKGVTTCSQPLVDAAQQIVAPTPPGQDAARKP